VGLRRGTLTFSRFFVDATLPRDLRKRFLEAVRLRKFQALAPEDEATEASGWCVIERPFDLEFNPEKIFEDRYLLLGFRIDRWRIPSALLNAQLADEEQVLLARKGREKLSRTERQELKQRVLVRLRRKATPVTKTVDVCWDLEGGEVFFFTHAKRLQLDFAALFEKTFGFALVPNSPYAAAQRSNLPKKLLSRLEDISPLSLSSGRKALARAAEQNRRNAEKAKDETPNEAAAEQEAVAETTSDALLERIESTRFLGTEFLLWIWLRGETLDTKLKLRDLEGCEGWIDNNITFQSMIDPNERMTLRGAAPSGSDEAKSALLAQKYPVRARLALRISDRDYACVLDALRFAVASGVIPAVLAKQADDAFLERIYLIDQLNLLLDRAFEAFLSVRLADVFQEAWEPAFVSWVEGETIPAALLERIADARRPRKSRAS
jgi:hypothetical protein